MSYTVFFALCILGLDFLIYFFLKLTYGEKNRVARRHLPREYYSESHFTAPLYRVPTQKNRRSDTKRVIPFGEPRRERATWRKPQARTANDNFAEQRAYRRIASSFAQAKPAR